MSSTAIARFAFPASSVGEPSLHKLTTSNGSLLPTSYGLNTTTPATTSAVGAGSTTTTTATSPKCNGLHGNTMNTTANSNSAGGTTPINRIPSTTVVTRLNRSAPMGTAAGSIIGVSDGDLHVHGLAASANPGGASTPLGASTLASGALSRSQSGGGNANRTAPLVRYTTLPSLSKARGLDGSNNVGVGGANNQQQHQHSPTGGPQCIISPSEGPSGVSSTGSLSRSLSAATTAGGVGGATPSATPSISSPTAQPRPSLFTRSACPYTLRASSSMLKHPSSSMGVWDGSSNTPNPFGKSVLTTSPSDVSIHRPPSAPNNGSRSDSKMPTPNPPPPPSAAGSVLGYTCSTDNAQSTTHPNRRPSGNVNSSTAAQPPHSISGGVLHIRSRPSHPSQPTDMYTHLAYVDIATVAAAAAGSGDSADDDRSAPLGTSVEIHSGSANDSVLRSYMTIGSSSGGGSITNAYNSASTLSPTAAASAGRNRNSLCATISSSGGGGGPQMGFRGISMLLTSTISMSRDEITASSTNNGSAMAEESPQACGEAFQPATDSDSPLSAASPATDEASPTTSNTMVDSPTRDPIAPQLVVTSATARSVKLHSPTAPSLPREEPPKEASPRHGHTATHSSNSTHAPHHRFSTSSINGENGATPPLGDGNRKASSHSSTGGTNALPSFAMVSSEALAGNGKLGARHSSGAEGWTGSCKPAEDMPCASINQSPHGFVGSKTSSDLANVPADVLGSDSEGEQRNPPLPMPSLFVASERGSDSTGGTCRMEDIGSSGSFCSNQPHSYTFVGPGGGVSLFSSPKAAHRIRAGSGGGNSMDGSDDTHCMMRSGFNASIGSIIGAGSLNAVGGVGSTLSRGVSLRQYARMASSSTRRGSRDGLVTFKLGTMDVDDASFSGMGGGGGGGAAIGRGFNRSLQHYSQRLADVATKQKDVPAMTKLRAWLATLPHESLIDEVIMLRLLAFGVLAPSSSTNPLMHACELTTPDTMQAAHNAAQGPDSSDASSATAAGRVGTGTGGYTIPALVQRQQQEPVKQALTDSSNPAPGGRSINSYNSFRRVNSNYSRVASVGFNAATPSVSGGNRSTTSMSIPRFISSSVGGGAGVGDGRTTPQTNALNTSTTPTVGHLGKHTSAYHIPSVVSAYSFRNTSGGVPHNVMGEGGGGAGGGVAPNAAVASRMALSLSHSGSQLDDLFRDISDYMVIEEVGKGQYGTVVKAVKAGEDQIFAIKIIPKVRLRKRFMPRRPSMQSVSHIRSVADVGGMVSFASKSGAVMGAPIVDFHSFTPRSICMDEKSGGDKLSVAPLQLGAPAAALADDLHRRPSHGPRREFSNPNTITSLSGVGGCGDSQPNSARSGGVPMSMDAPLGIPSATSATSRRAMQQQLGGVGGAVPRVLIKTPEVTPEEKALAIPISPFLSPGGYRVSPSNQSLAFTGGHRAPGTPHLNSVAMGVGAGHFETTDALKREIAVMKSLRHRNIVPLQEVIDLPDDENVYIVMPFIEKGPIATINKQTGKCHALEVDTIRTYMRQLLQAVSYLHKRQIAHCDIKPDNILLGGDGKIYLVDFGVSVMFDNSPEEVINGGGGGGASTGMDVALGGFRGSAADLSVYNQLRSESDQQQTSTLGRNSAHQRGGSFGFNSNPNSFVPFLAGNPEGSFSLRQLHRVESDSFVVHANGSQLEGGGVNPDGLVDPSNKTTDRISSRSGHRPSISYAHNFALHASKCTPAFASPESITGGKFNGAKADMWSVGVVMYVLLFGRTPFVGDSAFEVFAQISDEKGIVYDNPMPDALFEKAQRLVALAQQHGAEEGDQRGASQDGAMGSLCDQTMAYSGTCGGIAEGSMSPGAFGGGGGGTSMHSPPKRPAAAASNYISSVIFAHSNNHQSLRRKGKGSSSRDRANQLNAPFVVSSSSSAVSSSSSDDGDDGTSDEDDDLEEAAVAIEHPCALQAAVYALGLPLSDTGEGTIAAGILPLASLSTLGFTKEHGLVRKYMSALSLLARLLQRDPTSRYSARKALEHPFIGKSAFQQMRGLRLARSGGGGGVAGSSGPPSSVTYSNTAGTAGIATSIPLMGVPAMTAVGL